ncbi:MAG: hypothetical protein ABI407_19930 [Bradyrhizobium sp.]
MQRRRIRHRTSFEQRLADQSHLTRERAKNLPPGKDRDALMRKARQIDTASQLNNWLTSTTPSK